MIKNKVYLDTYILQQDMRGTVAKVGIIQFTNRKRKNIF